MIIENQNRILLPNKNNNPNNNTNNNNNNNNNNNHIYILIFLDYLAFLSSSMSFIFSSYWLTIVSYSCFMKAISFWKLEMWLVRDCLSSLNFSLSLLTTCSAAFLPSSKWVLYSPRGSTNTGTGLSKERMSQ